MGKVEVAVRLENAFDLTQLQMGTLSPDGVRTVDYPRAFVDTGATSLAAPRSVIEQLGLFPVGSRPVRTTNGIVQRTIFGPVRLTIQDRDFRCEISELPDDGPMLIGQIPLEGLDLVVDTVGRRLIGNPAHGGVAMLEEYGER